jgi:hypothetical protein
VNGNQRKWQGAREYAAPILIGLLILAAGLLPWTVLAQIDARRAAGSPCP